MKEPIVPVTLIVGSIAVAMNVEVGALAAIMFGLGTVARAAVTMVIPDEAQGNEGQGDE